MIKKVLFLYKTPRKKIYRDWESGRGPDTILYGANHLKKLGFDLKIYDIAFSKFNPFLWLFYPVQYFAGKLTGIGFKLDQALLCLSQVDKETVIVSTMDTAGLPILFLKKMRLLKSRVIYVSVGLAQLLNNNSNKFPFFWYKTLFKCADAIICYSKYETDILKNFNNKTYLIPPGTDTDFYIKNNGSAHKSSKRPMVLAFGRDIDRDYRTFISAIKGKKVKGVIVTSKENLSGLTLPQNVKAYFDLQPLQLKKLIKEADIVVIPIKKIKWAAGQLSTLDALAYKKSVIIPNLPALTATFNLKNGINCTIYDAENPLSLSQKIDWLIANHNLSRKIAVNGQKTARNYSTKIFANKLLDIIRKFDIDEQN